MEKLVALCYMWAFGLDDKVYYYAELDRLFLENPEDDLPFYSLSYAYLPLDEYGDEKQTREFFQKVFDYYKEKS